MEENTMTGGKGCASAVPESGIHKQFNMRSMDFLHYTKQL